MLIFVKQQCWHVSMLFWIDRYCNQVLSKEIDECVTLLLQELVSFQERIYQKDPTRAKARRRLVMGLREVTKHMKLNKIKCVIISPNCEKIQSKGIIDKHKWCTGLFSVLLCWLDVLINKVRSMLLCVIVTLPDSNWIIAIPHLILFYSSLEETHSWEVKRLKKNRYCRTEIHSVCYFILCSVHLAESWALGAF